MRRVKQSSLDRLNLMLTTEDLTGGLSIPREQLELTEIHLRFPCPLHPAEGGEERDVHIDRMTRYGWCRNGRCSFNQGGSLLWLYSRALRQDITDVAEALAARKKLQIEYEFWIGDTTPPQTDSFVHVEVVPEEGRAAEVLHVDELAAFARHYPEGARVNPLRFEGQHAEDVRQRRRMETLSLLGNLYLLLRAPVLPGARGAEEGLDLALADARFLCHELMERFHVPEEALAICFCAEGVHLEVDYRVFGVQPDPALGRIYQRLAYLLGGVDDQAPSRPLPGGGHGHPARTPTLAQDAYRHDFLWTLEGARGGPGGLCKIWISLHELVEKEARNLRDLAREPRRPLDPPLRLSLERLARGLFICAQEREARGRPALAPVLGEEAGRGLAAAERHDTVVSAAGGRASVQTAGRAPASGATAEPARAPSVAVVSGRATAAPAASARAATTTATAALAREGSVTPSGPPTDKGRAPVAREGAPAGGSTPATASAAARGSASAGGATSTAPGAVGTKATQARTPGSGAQAPSATAPARAESSLADLLAHLTSRERLPIPVTAFGSKNHPGDGLNQALQGGLHVGQVVALVGATGEGKTTFALQLADGVAFDNVQRERDSQPTVPVLFLSGQARPEALLMKSLSRLGKLDSGDILRGKGQAKDLQEAMRIYQSFHRHMSVQALAPQPDLDRIRRSLEDLLRAGARAALLVVDPLSALMMPDSNPGDGTTRLCRYLSALARELPIAVLAVIACRTTGKGGPLDYVEEVAPLAEWLDVALGLKTDLEIERAGGVLSLDERVGWKREWKAELKRKADGAPLKRGGIDYRDVWKTEYSVLMTLKSRWQLPVHTAYHFHKSVHRFEEI